MRKQLKRAVMIGLLITAGMGADACLLPPGIECANGSFCPLGEECSGDGTTCVPSGGCGNAIVSATEECDDGNITDGDGCSHLCNVERCGDGDVDSSAGEVCDDGNIIDGDGCSANCKSNESCGNMIVDTARGEVCDDGNPNNGDGCDNNCRSTGCGNGVVVPPEVCDDGNPNNGDGCDSNCTVTACGNGVITIGETCDDGNTTNGDACDNNCTVTACGNGVVTTGELCDDGDTNSGDGCDSNCMPTGCGNGVVTPTTGELCDDGNNVNGDGCDSNCKPTGCGNGIPTTGEQCDDSNTSNTDDCVGACVIARCGDTFVRMGVETCDDGNAVTEACPYGIPFCLVCDDTCNIAPGAVTFCGDGTRQLGPETCDDGNLTCGTCSMDCQTFASATSVGALRVIKPSEVVAMTDTFTLNDGINPAVTFQYINGGFSTGSNVAIDIMGLSPNDVGGLRTRTVGAINNVEMNTGELLLITATPSGSASVNLKHDRFTSSGNIAIIETVSDNSFDVIGMSGGAGGDCASLQPCRSGADCISGTCTANVCQ